MELIERHEFLELLQTHFKTVAEGEGHCVFVNGEAGIGKTALVKAFCKQKETACKIFLGACDDLFTPRPLAPLYDILSQMNHDISSNNYSINERSGLFAKLFQEFRNQNEKVIIVFEDIHWADEATLDFIKFFARRIAQLRCMFILTYRDEEIHQRHHLRNVFSDLSPDNFTRIQLTPLSREAVQKMADKKGYDAQNVYNISGGNPFYVNEILASYSPGVPDNIKDSILAVYDRQEEGTKNVWQILSVIPEGLEINRYAKIKSSWDKGMDNCFALKVIIIKTDKIIFKHELYRRTIEDSLSPFKRIELNKKLLELLISSFEEDGEIERIVHYAKNANENKLVIKYAPLAAKQAASVGAHIEAAKLFLTAIEYSDGKDIDGLVELHEAYAYECYLTSQVKEAIIYLGRALKIWQDKNNFEQAGNSLQFLSRLWSLDGNAELAEKYGIEAIEMLESQPSSNAKAIAFSNMAQLKLVSQQVMESIEWANNAVAIAEETGDKNILCHTLNNAGSIQWAAFPAEDNGKNMLVKSLEMALQYYFHEEAASAYLAIVCNSVACKEYDLAKQFLQAGINYCEEKGLISANSNNLSFKCRILLETGDWVQATEISKSLLQNQGQPETIKIDNQLIVSTIKIRKGEADILSDLQDIKTLAFKTKEYQQIIRVIIALLEYEWVSTKKIITEEELKYCIGLVQKGRNVFLNSAFDFWLQKARHIESGLAELYEPYRQLKEGNPSAAVTFWERLGCPYEKAFALTEGDDDDKRKALLIFEELGADEVCQKLKMEMRAGGIKKIPRGLRESTKANPAGLTNRELDIIQLMQKAIQNKEIASTLFISPKTVDHHISSILFKLEVNSRSKAVTEAVRLGILK
jgi:DNA-binding CsgD family transcriptional regulator/tetratricopeptide (TPR) repeat protein